jgi:hypothetical protein
LCKRPATTVEPLLVKRDLIIYPNPSNSDISISGNFDIEHIDIVNNLGQIVQTIDNPDGTISLNKHSKGIYFIHAHSSDGKIATKKIVKI